MKEERESVVQRGYAVRLDIDGRAAEQVEVRAIGYEEAARSFAQGEAVSRHQQAIARGAASLDVEGHQFDLIQRANGQVALVVDLKEGE